MDPQKENFLGESYIKTSSAGTKFNEMKKRFKENAQIEFTPYDIEKKEPKMEK